MRIRFFEFIATFVGMAAICHGQGTISTVAGSATCCNSADGQQATSAWIPATSGITLDKQGNLYIWDGSSSLIRKVNTAGIISTVAGNANAGYSGDGGQATSASLFASGTISGLAIDAAGNLYISDGNNHAVRMVDTSGIIRTVAGKGTLGFSGDGGQATSAQLQYPAGIAVDSSGNLYVADSSNNRIRKVTPGGIISTFAGNGNASFSGDNVQATTTAVNRPEGVTVDAAGNVYIAETSDSRVRKVAPNGIIGTVAGQTKKTIGFAGDGGPATAALLSGPAGMVVDAAGNLYIADNGNSRIRKVDAAGTITTYAGITGTASTPIGDGGPATSAFLGVPKDVALDAAGNLYVAGSAGGKARVRKITPGAGLSSNPSSLSFAYTIGGANPASQTVTVTSAGAALSFSAAASTTSGGTWLSVNPSGGNTPATLTVSVNPQGIQGGVYQGAVTLTPSGAGVSPLSFSVTLTITGAGAPVITSGGIINASGYQTKLAPDTVFVIFGSAMGPAALAAAGAPNYPNSLGGTSITFTPAAGGAAISAKMVYSVASQIAGLLPSSIAPGTYAVRVTFNSLTSAPQNVTVVARSFGIATSNSAGTGTAQATIGNVNGGLSLTRFTTGSVAFGGYTWTLSPTHPGDTVVLWGTGGGADLANDTGGSSGDQTAAGNFKVNVSGRSITPAYAGASSGYPGLWQINFALPVDMTPDCFASLQVTAAGEPSNAVAIPIAAAGQAACTDSQLSQTALAALDAGGTVVGGGFGMARATNTFSQSATPGGAVTNTTASQENVSGRFAVYTATEYAALFGGIKIGLCTVSDRTAPSTTKNPAGPDGYLDAGVSLPFSGPGAAGGAALTVAVNTSGPIYDLLLPNGTIQTGGRYALSGAGGKGVGAFNVAVNYPPNFTVTGWDALTTIDRNKPLTISWTGAIDQVIIIGSTSAVVGKDASNTNIIHNVSFTCQVPAAPGSYTLPTALLSYLLPEGIDVASSATGSGLLAVESSTSQSFTAPLVAGGQVAWAGLTATLTYSKNLIVQ